MTDPLPTDPQHQQQPPTYEALHTLTHLTTQIDAATLAFQNHLLRTHHQPSFSSLTSRIPHFWPLVFEQAPQDVDQYIQPSDSRVFAECLEGVEVERFESKGETKDFVKVLQQAPSEVGNFAAKDIGAGSGASTNGLIPDIAATNPFGEPRSLRITFTFAPNEWFEDRTLIKNFYYRYARPDSSDAPDPTPWSGLVSDPVRIHWKKGKDLSEGLTDVAFDLWEAQGKRGLLEGPSQVGGGGAGGVQEASEGQSSEETETNRLDEDRKRRDEASKALPEYKRAVDKVENSTEGSLSFFCWFGFRGRWVGRDEDLLARREEQRRISATQVQTQTNGDGATTNGSAQTPNAKNDAATAGSAEGEGSSLEGGANANTNDKQNDDSDSDDEESLTPTTSAAEVFISGEELALALAEDIYPNAIRYFTDAQMEGDDEEEEEDDETLSSGSFDGAELEEMVAGEFDGVDDEEGDGMEGLDEGERNLEEIRLLGSKGGGKGKRKGKGKGKREREDGDEGVKKRRV